MNLRPIALRGLAFGVGAALWMPLAAHAQPLPADLAVFLSDALPFCSPGPDGRMPGERGGGLARARPRPGGPDSPIPARAMSRSPEMNETQRDKVFAVQHARSHDEIYMILTQDQWQEPETARPRARQP